MSSSDDPADSVWVVGIDGSDGASGALTWAHAHIAARASTMRIVTCWRPPWFGPYPVVDEEMSSPYDDSALERHALTMVQRTADALDPLAGVDVVPIARRGRATHALLEESSAASLLIVGRRGRGGFAGLRIGSTSAQCVTHSRVPVVVVPEQTRGTTSTIVVGDDGSPDAAAALRWALEFATADTTVLAVTAAEDDQLEHRSDPATDPRVTWRVEQGSARAVLRAASEHADLVVVGARGSGGIGAALLGSVSTWLLHHVSVPIVVVPEGTRGGAST